MKTITVSAALCSLIHIGACGAAPSARHVRLVERSDSVDGARIHYRIGGSGPALLFLHGFVWSGETWERYADVLGRTHTVIIPDLPGHGESTGLPQAWNTTTVAKQVLELLDHLNVSRFRGIGCSIGSLTLMNMALQQPSRVDALALISATHRLSNEDRDNIRNSPVEESPDWVAWNRFNNHDAVQMRELLTLFRRLADNQEDFNVPSERLSTIRTPTLLITGDRDQSPSLEQTLELHRTLPNSSLWVLPNVGHCPFWKELPQGSAVAEELFPTVVLDFLSRTAG